MATLDLEEQEQVDAFKAWWSDNGKLVIWTIVLIIAGIFGTQAWQSYKTTKKTEAAMLFADMLKQTGSNDPKRISDVAAALADKYGSSAYAPRAELVAAQMNINAKANAQARNQLQWVIEHAEEEGLKNVARLKLASVLLDERNYAEATKLLDASHPESFNGLYSDLKGDVLNAQGKTEEARTAYQEALSRLDAKSMYRALIQMKLDALGGAK